MYCRSDDAWGSLRGCVDCHPQGCHSTPTIYEFALIQKKNVHRFTILYEKEILME